jgi:signal transduction histidine kinase
VGLAADVTEWREMVRIIADTVQTLVMAEDVERRRIARELHDGTAQHLVAIDLGIASLERRLPPDAEAHILADLRSSLAAAHREIRTFSYLLHPPELERSGLEETMRQFVHGFEARTGIKVNIAINGVISDLGSERDLTLFRVLQEALMNVHRHADANTATVRLQRERNSVTLEVLDDGHGYVADSKHSASTGVGVMGMKARVTKLGGRLLLFSSAEGFCVRAQLPLTAERGS